MHLGCMYWLVLELLNRRLIQLIFSGSAPRLKDLLIEIYFIWSLTQLVSCTSDHSLTLLRLNCSAAAKPFVYRSITCPRPTALLVADFTFTVEYSALGT